MSDDILTLLRKYQPYSKLHGRAADEIERLRKAIVDYVMTISDCYATPATDSDALELLKQAVRGE